MRIKYSSIRNVLEPNPAAPWVGPGLAEKLKREAVAERAKKDNKENKDDKDNKKEEEPPRSERALAWFRRSR
jgi:hypothetical protein